MAPINVTFFSNSPFKNLIQNLKLLSCVKSVHSLLFLQNLKTFLCDWLFFIFLFVHDLFSTQNGPKMQSKREFSLLIPAGNGWDPDCAEKHKKQFLSYYSWALEIFVL